MEFKIGQFYKTREGNKVVVYALYPEHNRIHGAVLISNTPVDGTREWKSCGAFSMIGEHPLDLVSEWSDPVSKPKPEKRKMKMRINIHTGGLHLFPLDAKIEPGDWLTEEEVEVLSLDDEE